MYTNSVPLLTVEQLAVKLQSHDRFILLDVREVWELDLAKIVDDRLNVMPMSRLAAEGLVALPESAKSQDAEIFVLCHHGVRSADVINWLASQGWKNTFSVAGGIDEYATKIDGSVGFY
jgi:rhodanese-related sulfurtransferase